MAKLSTVTSIFQRGRHASISFRDDRPVTFPRAGAAATGQETGDDFVVFSGWTRRTPTETFPEAHLAFSSQVYWDTVNRAALEKTYGSAETFMQRLQNMIVYDSTWLSQKRAEITTRWNDWISR